MASRPAMTHRIRFERRGSSTDAYGNTQSDFATLLTVWAGLRLRAQRRETVEAARLEPSIAGIVSIYRSTAAQGLTTADRGVFTTGPWTGRILNIRAIAPSEDRRYLEISFDEGVST